MTAISIPTWVNTFCIDIQQGHFSGGLKAQMFNDVLKWLLQREFIVGQQLSAVFNRVTLDKPVRIPEQLNYIDISVGQAVYVIGAPFGFSGSVASGIVSSVREDSKFLRKTRLIQTDIAINPGNSGGPLFTYSSNLVGVITNIMSTNGGSQGVSFAVSIDAVMKSVDKILQRGAPRFSHD